MNLWDSTPTKTSQRADQKTRQGKSKSHFTPNTNETLENQRVIAKLFTLWDGCVQV